jgi:hypothetical protein
VIGWDKLPTPLGLITLVGIRRELGVPRYTKFRELFHLRPVRTFGELTDIPVWREEIRRVYENDLDKVDLISGLFAETAPKGFGFSDTVFAFLC